MIKIIVDSGCDITSEEAKQLSLSLIPLSVIFGDECFEEGQNISREQFYERMSKDVFPKTAQPSTQAFISVFEKEIALGNEVIYIGISGALSGTIVNAMSAQKIVGSDLIHIVDSKSASYGIKLLALHALKLVKEGNSAEMIVDSLNELKKRICIYACLDTLENLSRGGRIPSSIATISDTINMKIIISVDEKGKVVVSKKSFGIKRAMLDMIKLIKASPIDYKHEVYGVYTSGKDNVEHFIDKLTKDDVKVDDCLQIGCAIGAHVGERGFGIIYIKQE